MQALYDAAPDDFGIFRAAVDGEFIAGMCTYRFGQVGEYYVGWVSKRGARRTSTTFCSGGAALDLRSRGCHWIGPQRNASRRNRTLQDGHGRHRVPVHAQLAGVLGAMMDEPHQTFNTIIRQHRRTPAPSHSELGTGMSSTT